MQTFKWIKRCYRKVYPNTVFIHAAKMNLRSSRSHTIFRLILERAEANPENEKKKLTVVAALNLVDLAGSESIKKVGWTVSFLPVSEKKKSRSFVFAHL